MQVCNSSSAVVVKSYSHLNFIDKHLNIVSLAKAHGVMHNVLSYYAILDAVIRSKGSVQLAEEVFSELIRNGVSPNVYTYIYGHCLRVLTLIWALINAMGRAIRI